MECFINILLEWRNIWKQVNKLFLFEFNGIIFQLEDAPSVRKEKNLILCDIDFIMRGNPYCLIKSFIQ